MCGIVGIRRFDGGLVDQALLRHMAAQLVHRGPDDEGFWFDGPIAFGHRRLSIIDLDSSAQPMPSADGRLHVCFNGEILNYEALRRETPFHYRTGGDTEVLLATFARSGARSVEQLEGQFAYALHDDADDVLWLFRDRLGILPLYYYWDANLFAFASEIKALLPVLPSGPKVDFASVGDYLTRRSVPSPWTLFEGIRKIPPACYLRVPANGAPAEPVRYWRIPEAAPSVVSDVAEAGAELDSLLRAAVRRNLVADVPVGAYLSGGIDSSLIVALMRSLEPEQEIKTFAASFGDPRFDESAYAREVATIHRTVHEEVHVDAAEFQELWPVLTWHRDAPISEASDVAVYRLAELAARSVKVVLSGEGADELFAGYPKHRFARLTSAAGLVPGAFRQGPMRVLDQWLPKVAARQRIAVRMLGERTMSDRLEAWFAPFTARERAVLLGGRTEHDRRLDLAKHGDPLRQMLVADVCGWLPDNLLERGDRMSLAASLELRPPFLDADLVEWAFGLSSRLKARGSRGKWIVRQVARSYLPTTIIDRPKIGFRVPLDAWFRGPLRDHVADLLLSNDSFVGKALDRAAVVGLVRRHIDGRANEELRIWTLLSLEIWHQTFFTHARPSAPRRPTSASSNER